MSGNSEHIGKIRQIRSNQGVGVENSRSAGFSEKAELTVMKHLHFPDVIHVRRPLVLAKAETEYRQTHRADLSINKFIEAVYQSRAVGSELALGE